MGEEHIDPVEFALMLVFELEVDQVEGEREGNGEEVLLDLHPPIYQLRDFEGRGINSISLVPLKTNTDLTSIVVSDIPQEQSDTQQGRVLRVLSIHLLTVESYLEHLVLEEKVPLSQRTYLEPAKGLIGVDLF